MFHFTENTIDNILITRYENLLQDQQKVYDEVGPDEFFKKAGHCFTVQFSEMSNLFEKTNSPSPEYYHHF